MPQARWTVLCQRPLVASDSNQISYIDCVESLVAPGLPSELPPLFVCVDFKRTKGDPDGFSVRVRALDPDGKTGVWESETISGRFGGKTFIRANFMVRGLQVAKVGDYDFVVEFGSGKRFKEISRVSLMIDAENGDG